MSTILNNKPADEIREQIHQLETQFKKKQTRNFQLGYPLSMTLLVGSIALWIIFTGMLMMSAVGSLAGFLVGCLVLSIMILCFRVVYKRWNRKSIRRIRQTAQTLFDDQFPAAEIESRRLAMDILQENAEKYSLAQVLLDPQQHTPVSVPDTPPPLRAQQL
jgi:hypothetical protein